MFYCKIRKRKNEIKQREQQTSEVFLEESTDEDMDAFNFEIN